VIQFYKTHLQGWNYDEKFNIFFKSDQDGDFPFEQLNHIPNVTVHKIEGATPVRKIMPEAQCLINIIYEPLKE
ncbi:MAG: hypothetical protein ACK4ND_15110, partial [Cytophagaceae bacterium]